MAIQCDKALLEQACKEIIETILICLPNAYKGTVYRIGHPPEMTAERITSGFIAPDRKNISWGLPQRSDYNPPGKRWVDYRDEETRPLEAMAWCVEKQKSWTAENPGRDARSARRQAEGARQDVFHMEPVLVRKEDLYIGEEPALDYPRNSRGEILWQDSDYAVVAVIKIHFRPNTIRVGSPETRIIKKLSRALGTELLSYQIRQQSVEAMQQVAQDTLKSCNILADSLRNAITKSGLIFSLIKLELMALREQWECVLLKNSNEGNLRHEAVELLNSALTKMDGTAGDVGKELMDAQNRFLDLFLPPRRGEKWIEMKIEKRWEEILRRNPLGESQSAEIRLAIENLKKCLYLGQDPKNLARYDRLDKGEKEQWVALLYHDADPLDFQFLERLIQVLTERSLELPYQEKSRKRLIYLKTLAQIMDRLEDDTNVVLRQILNGFDEGTLSDLVNNGSRSS